jgi:hypothetical protein
MALSFRAGDWTHEHIPTITVGSKAMRHLVVTTASRSGSIDLVQEDDLFRIR